MSVTSSSRELNRATSPKSYGEIKSQPSDLLLNDVDEQMRRFTAVQSAKVSAQNIMLGWENFTISSLSPPEPILRGVSGYVVKGGITAIVGASSSGKSLFMKALSGRTQTLSVTGKISLNGEEVDPKNYYQPISYVPQEDILIGELTLRQTLSISSRLRNPIESEEHQKKVNELINNMGLAKVSDNIVGTILRRGMSGGEKRRTSVGVELITTPSALLLDEPTSGLDASSAYLVIQTIRSLVYQSKGQMSVVLSIHQPNSRILSLFDHIMILGRGGMIYFGTLRDTVKYFDKIGYPVPDNQTPTDHFLQVTDPSFRTHASKEIELDFAAKFQNSIDASHLHHLLVQNRKLKESVMSFDPEPSKYQTSYVNQFLTIFERNCIVAIKDVTLYYLQWFLIVFYGFLIGMTFYQSKPHIGPRQNDTLNGVVWLSFPYLYIHVFKVFYLVNSNKRYHHEHSNNSYGTVPFWLADFSATAIFSASFLLAGIIGWLVMDLPSDQLGFGVLVFYLLNLTSECAAHIISQFTENTPLAIVCTQALYVISSFFAGGAFIRWDDVPGYWLWLQELLYETHATRALLIGVMDSSDFRCDGREGAATYNANTCSFGGYTFPCSQGNDAATCIVSGRDYLSIAKGVNKDTDKWDSVGYLFLLFCISKLFLLVFLRFPPKLLINRFQQWREKGVSDRLLAHRIEIDRLTRHIRLMKEEYMVNDERHQAALKIQEWWRKLKFYDMFRSLVVLAVKKSKGSEKANMERDLKHTASMRQFSKKRSHEKLQFRNLTLTLPNGKVLLDHIEGEATPGRVLGIMGPSGAGKTTLLNALSGRAPYAKTTGAVQFGGFNLGAHHLSYVPQFDDFNGNFTVRETLTYTARMKTVGLNEQQVYQRVAELMYILGLGKRADEVVSNLTGGELKKLSIGVGLVSDPKVLFLDEPTTGLDSAASYNIMTYIAKVARMTGVVVVVTIHQPAFVVFQQLDDLMLLENGRLAYYGKAGDAKLFFDSLNLVCPRDLNPADFYLDCISHPPTHTSDSWKQVYQKSSFVQHLKFMTGDNAVEVEQPTEWTRLYYSTLHQLQYFYREIAIHPLRAAELIFIAFFVGTIFVRLDKSVVEVEKFSGALFFNIWCVLFAVVAATPSYAIDRRHALNEFMNGNFKIWTYCLSNFMASLPFTFGISIIYQAIFHFVVGFKDTFEAYMYAVLMTVLLVIIMESIVLMVILVLKDAMLCVTFSMVVLGTLFLFPGFFVLVENMPVGISWIPWMIPTKYSFRGLLYNVFNDQNYALPGGGSMEGYQVLNQFFDINTKHTNMWVEWVFTLLFALALRFGHWFIMDYQTWAFTASFDFEEVPEDDQPSPKSKDVVVNVDTSDKNVELQEIKEEKKEE